MDGSEATATQQAAGQPAAQPGWYAAQGDPPGTLRYWNGSQWVGEPVPGTTVGQSGETVLEAPAVEWSTAGLAQASTDYANWGQRVAAFLIDAAVLIPFIVGAVAAFVAAEEADANSVEADSPLWIVGAVLFFLFFVVAFVNSVIVHGMTGQTVGKRVMKTMLVEETSGKPAGVGRVFGRGLIAVIAGNLTANIFTIVDRLWPLWDDKNQRIADKVTSTVVINKPPK